MTSKSSPLSQEDALASIKILEPRLASLNAEECLSLVHSYLLVAQNYLARQEDPQLPDPAQSTVLSQLSTNALAQTKQQELQEQQEMLEHQRFEHYVEQSLHILNEHPLPEDAMLLSDWYFLKISLYLLKDDPLQALQACENCEEAVGRVGNLVFKSMLLEQLQMVKEQCKASLKDLNQPQFKAAKGFAKHSFLLGLLRKDQEAWLSTPNLFYERLALARDFVVVEYAQYKIDPREHPDYFSFLVKAQYLAESAEAEEKRSQTVAAERQEIIRRKQERLEQEKQHKSYEDIITSDLDPEELTKQLKLLNERNKNYVPDPSKIDNSITTLGGMGMAESLKSLSWGEETHDYVKDAHAQTLLQNEGISQDGSFSSSLDPLNQDGSQQDDTSAYSSVDFAKSRAISLKEAAKQEKLKNQDQFQNAPLFHVFFRNQIFKARIFATEVNQLFLNWRARYPLAEPELSQVASLKKGVAVIIESGNDPFDTYKLQLLMLSVIVPNLICAVDQSSEQIFPGDWVRFSAHLSTDIDSRSLYSIQAVSDRDRVWLHTHGLSRFGMGELEILDCPARMYQYCGDVIHAMATIYLNRVSRMMAYEPQLVAHLANDTPLITTLVPWPEAVKYYSKLQGDNFTGAARDRNIDHNSESYAIFCYENYQNYKNHDFKPLSVYSDQINDDTVVLLTQAETEREHRKAMETFAFIAEYSQTHNLLIMAKMSLKISSDHQGGASAQTNTATNQSEAFSDNPQELCWFTITKIYNQQQMQGRLDNDPFYIKYLRQGDLVDLPVSRIADWKAFDLNTKQIFTPNSAFLLLR